MDAERVADKMLSMGAPSSSLSFVICKAFVPELFDGSAWIAPWSYEFGPGMHDVVGRNAAGKRALNRKEGGRMPDLKLMYVYLMRPYWRWTYYRRRGRGRR